jgi:hypothetical protein
MLQRRVGNDTAVPEIIGNAGGNAPLAMMCSGSISSLALSK